MTSDAPFRTALETAPVAVVLCDRAGVVRWLNALARAEREHASPDDDPRGRPWQQAFPGLAGDGFAGAFDAVAVGEPGAIETVEVPGPAGLRRLRLSRLPSDAVAVYLEPSTVAGSEAEAQEREREVRGLREYRDAIERYPFGAVVSFDQDHRYIVVAGKGWIPPDADREALVGRTLREAWPSDVPYTLDELADVALDGREAAQRIPYDGRIFELWAGPMAPTDDGRRRGLFVSHDVTAEVRQNERIRLLERATDAASVGITLADVRQEDQPLVYASRGFLRMTGYSRSEVVGRNCRFLQGPSTDSVSVDEIRRAIAERRSIVQTLLNYRKDGGPFWNRVSLTPFSPDGNGITHYVGIQEDVSEIRESQAERSHSQRLAELGTLAGSVAHDFNNYLMEIRGRVAICEGDPQADRDDELRGIDHAAAQGSALVAQLLGYARRSTDAGREEEPSALLREVVKSVLRILPANVAVSMDHPETPLPIAMDRMRLEQVLMNLVKNAADAMPRGGDLRVCLAPDDTPGWATITVEDTGTGMTDEVRARAFQPFFTTKGSAGTGLGLSSIANILERVGGRIEVESEVGVGTTFRVRVPTTSRPHPPVRRAAAQLKAKAPSLEGLRILVADDQPGIRSVLARLLGHLGLDVSTARDGADALRMIEEADPPFDVLLVDRDMPAMTGDRVLWRVADAQPEAEKRPWMVLMSGELNLAPADLPEGVALVEKPFEMPEMIEMLQKLVTGTQPEG